MTGLLICAAVVGLTGGFLCRESEREYGPYGASPGKAWFALGLALLAVALWLAYAAGGAA